MSDDGLIGRERERAVLHALLEDARRGRSGACLVVGEAGIGKSALLADVAAQADGMWVLTTRGSELESELPFAGLSLLLGPVLHLLGELDVAQSAGLRAALGLTVPTRPDPLTVYAGTLAVLAAAAERTPVLALIDDAHWLDEASMRALAFVARRIEAEGIVLLLAARGDASRLIGSLDLPRLALAGLDAEAAAQLIRRRRHDVAPSVATRLADAAAGNPLVLAELARLLDDDQLLGRAELPDPLPSGAAVDALFAAAVSRLDGESALALLVAAAAAADEARVVRAACARLELDEGVLDTLEGAGLVTVERTVVFRHPTLRSVVYYRAPLEERRRAHRALADVLGGGGDDDRQAWHLARASAEPDEGVASALERVAADARARGAPGAAAAAAERAAHLTLRREDRLRRLCIAADNHASAASFSRVEAVLEEADQHARTVAERAQVTLLRGRVELLTSDMLLAHATLVEAAELYERLGDRTQAAIALTEASLGPMAAVRLDLAVATAARAVALADGVQPAQTIASSALAQSLLLSGEIDLPRSLLGDIEPVIEVAPVELVPLFLSACATFLITIDAFDRARELIERVTAALRRAGAVSALPHTLASHADLDYRVGSMSSALARATKAVELGRETGQLQSMSFALVKLADAEAVLGRAEACRAHVEEARSTALTFGVHAADFYGEAALCMLDLGIGDIDAAIEHGRHVERLCNTHGLAHPAIVQWEPNLIEAHARSGDTRAARELLGRFEAEAVRLDTPWALAAAARSRGLLAEDQYEAEFATALAILEPTPMAFERARTELCLGERRRRSGQRVEARRPLKSAFAAFERMGAEPWAARARVELQASGERLRRAAGSWTELTPHELEVAHVVARGATNREASAELFLSPKTIEFHLGRVYRKLGVRSRAELARLIAERESAPIEGEPATTA